MAVADEQITLTGIEVLKPGTYVDANGVNVEVTLSMMADMAAAYDPSVLDAPAVIGHPKMDAPAYGWLRNFRVDGEILLCDAEDVDVGFAEVLRKRRYKNKSLSFYRPTSPGNPKPGRCYPKHLGLLGARAPAVTGLKPIHLAAAGSGPATIDDGAVSVDLAEPSSGLFRVIANAFSAIRDHLVETEGAEKADGIVNSWVVNRIRDAAAEMEADQLPPALSTHIDQIDKGRQMANPTPDAAILAAREADLAAREAALIERERQDRQLRDEAFVEKLIAEARVPAGERQNILAELASMDDGAPTVSLAAEAGDAVLSQHAAYCRRLAAIPAKVQLGEHRPQGGDLDQVVDFAVPDGCAVNPSSLDLHRRASVLQAQIPGLAYLDALKRVGAK